MILVTGGAGFIGSHLVGHLVGLGQQVRVLDNLSSGSRRRLDVMGDAVEFVEGDVRAPQMVADAMVGVTDVYHLAAMVSVPECNANPLTACATNVQGTITMLHAAKCYGVRSFVFASSCAVYGDPEDQGERFPLSFYAAHKRTSEFDCLLYRKHFRLPVVPLRFYNVYGPGQNAKSQYAAVIPKFMEVVGQNKQPIIYGSGNQTRDFVYVDDVVVACVSASAKVRHDQGFGSRPIDVGSGESVSINDLLHTIIQVKGNVVAPEYLGKREGDIEHSRCPEGLEETFGFVPTSLKDGIEMMVGYEAS